MKILRFSQYIHNSSHEEFKRNTSGYGRSVWDICRFSSRNNNEEFLFSYANRLEKKIEDVRILKGSKYVYLRYIDSNVIKDFFGLLLKIGQFKNVSLRTKTSYLYYSLTGGYVSKIINDLKPDLIHIHGLTYSTLPFVKRALKSRIPIVVTLHGLNMDVANNEIEKEFEIKMIEFLNELNVEITVIGSGMIDTIKSNCEIYNWDKIRTINHGIDVTPFSYDEDKKNIKKSMKIDGKNVILSVGSISERRNQIALIRAVTLLDSNYQKNIIVFIIGEGELKSQLELEIKKYGLQDTVKLLGYKNHSELSKYYTIADMTAVLSKIEGFGRPILESYSYGVPVIAFEDLDAVDDLYCKGCMFKIKDRNDIAVSETIKEVLNSKLNKNVIIKYSRTKTWESALEKYQTVYDDSVSNFEYYIVQNEITNE